MTAEFYFGINELIKTADLNIAGVLSGALAVNPQTFDVVVGNNGNGAIMIEKLIDSDDYSIPADYTTGLGTTHDSIKRLEYL